MASGLFLTFEGSEGCGKTTQIERLAAALRGDGREVVLTREPGGTPLGERIRHILQHAPEGDAMVPETELLLFAASRAQLVRTVIAPALDRDAVVISDRFLDSTTVYQGVARRLLAAEVAAINAFAVGPHRPALTFILDLPAPEARARVFQNRAAVTPDRIEREPLDFYERVRAGYLALAAREPERCRVLDAARSREEIAAEILQHVQLALHGNASAARP